VKTARITLIGWLFCAVGVIVVVFGSTIVFPGLELLFGIETIVGRDNVVYREDGSYMFTNPGAMATWILSVAFVGILIFCVGAWLLIRSRVRRTD
jgi:hypothetical protein